MSATVYKQRENISHYLAACKSLGMSDTDCFMTTDLYEGSNLVAVIDNIIALSGAASKHGFAGPFIAAAPKRVELADKKITLDTSLDAIVRSSEAIARSHDYEAKAKGPSACPQCEAPREAGAKFCGNCGTTF